MIPKPCLWPIVVLLLTVFACRSQPIPAAAEKQMEDPGRSAREALDQLARETYRTSYEILYNQAGTMALVRKMVRPGKQVIYPTINFFLYDLVAQSEIYEDVVIQAESVEWISPEEIAVIFVARQIEDLDEKASRSGYIYNVKTQTKRLLYQK